MTIVVDYVEKIEKNINDLLVHCVGVELENSQLKKLIRILASSTSLDEDGNTVRTMTQQEAEFVKNTCEKYNVFGLTAKIK